MMFKPPKYRVEKYTRQDGSVYYKVREDHWWHFEKKYVRFYNRLTQYCETSFDSEVEYKKAIAECTQQKLKVYNSTTVKREVL